MKRSRFTDSQILAVLKQAEAGRAMPDLCREHGISLIPSIPIIRVSEWAPDSSARPEILQTRG
jgi:hypothetical protein